MDSGQADTQKTTTSLLQDFLNIYNEGIFQQVPIYLSYTNLVFCTFYFFLFYELLTAYFLRIPNFHKIRLSMHFINSASQLRVREQKVKGQTITKYQHHRIRKPNYCSVELMMRRSQQRVREPPPEFGKSLLIRTRYNPPPLILERTAYCDTFFRKLLEKKI